MGAAIAIVKALNPASICNTCSKYVLNDCKSHCTSGCCEVEIETEQVDLESGSEYSIDLGDDCCHASKK